MKDLYSCSEYSCSSIETYTTTSTNKWDDKICFKSLDNYVKSFNDYIGNNDLMKFLKGKNSCSLDYYSNKWEDCNIWKMSLGIYILSVFKYYNIEDEDIVNSLLDCNNVDRFCNIIYFLDDKKEDLKKYLNINEKLKEKNNLDDEKYNNLDNNKKDILDNYLEMETSKILYPQNKVNNSINLEDTINILNIKYKINSNKGDTNINNNIPKKVTLGDAYMTDYRNGTRKINIKNFFFKFYLLLSTNLNYFYFQN